MRIGIDMRPLTVPTFGIGRYTRELLSRLMQLAPEHDWYFYADRPILSPPESERATIREFSSHNRAMGLARTQLTFTHWANRDKLDLFWSPRHHLPLFLDSNIKQLLTVHDIVWKKFPQTMRPMNLFVERLLMPPSLQKADRIIAVSHATKMDLLDCMSVDEGKVFVIHEAAGEILSAHPPKEIEGRYFLFVGTHEPRKNLKRLIEAFDIYRAAGGGLRLVIAGANGWGEQVGQHSELLSLGYVSDDRLNGLLTHAHALVMPSLYEGFGLPLLEAIQRNVPVITSNVSSMPEIIGSAGIVIDPIDTEAISKALFRMENLAEHELFTAQCAAQSGRFSWDLAARETLRIIESLCPA